MFLFIFLAAEVVEQVKDKVSELTADAKEKGEGKYIRFSKKNSIISCIYMNRS